MSATPPSSRQPVIELGTAAPGVFLRASVDQQGMLFASLVHAESDAALSIVAHHCDGVRPAAHNALQVGCSVFLLAAGEAARYFAWLQSARLDARRKH